MLLLYDAPHSVLFQHAESQMITHAKSKDKGGKVGLKNTTSEMRSQFLWFCSVICVKRHDEMSRIARWLTSLYIMWKMS